MEAEVGRGLEVPEPASAGLSGGLQSPCFLSPHPPVPSAEQGVYPACPLHLLTGLLHLGPGGKKRH